MSIDNKNLVVIKGGGDIATGTIHKLVRSGFKCIVLELDKPSAIRRSVAFSESMYDGRCTVEGVEAVRAENLEEALEIVEEGKVAITSKVLSVNSDVYIDATISKKQSADIRNLAPMTIGLGPGFSAGENVDIVIETMRGHNLGRIITEGSAVPNTGIPGVIAGHSRDRVVYSPTAGEFIGLNSIGDTVTAGEKIGFVLKDESSEKEYVIATISGILRGIIRDGYYVTEAFKTADIDPRISEYDNCFTISDKARCIAGSVLEVVMNFKNNKENKNNYNLRKISPNARAGHLR
ncbi:MAG: EF2563 family selenium-dependent molybdenum hydroxylase system protein [Clostridioides sp.]|jgi:xanthine dehydrogenase accessory factor|nr:EF2563 family selenium-dependent molybdenum hydroxylase system protein [Clostridioides sp.]